MEVERPLSPRGEQAAQLQQASDTLAQRQQWRQAGEPSAGGAGSKAKGGESQPGRSGGGAEREGGRGRPSTRRS